MQDQDAIADRDLVAAALRDRDAFVHVVRRWQGPISRYVARLLGRHHGATEDVLQDIFLKVYVNLNAYDRQRPFGPWIYRVAHNEAASHLRRRRNEPHAIAPEDAARILDRLTDGHSVQEPSGAARTGEEIRLAIGALDERYRQILILRYLEEKSYDEIADILQLPPGTVATLLSRGTKKLRTLLAAAGIGLGREDA